MDVLERAIRAAGLPARYSEGFNPHMKLSMGPALPLGLESRHEVFDVEGVDRFPPDAAEAIAARLPAGLSVSDVRCLDPQEPALSKSVKSARYLVRLASPEQVDRASEAISNGWREAVPALRSLAIHSDEDGASLSFEVNLDQSAGETSTPKKVLEAILAIPPEAQATLSVTREATVLG
jgi:radical SAM-linked protein